MMDKEIKQFKQQNGNLVNYTVKELIGGLDVKIDLILKRLEKGETRFARIDTTLHWHNRLITTLYVVVGSFLIRPIRSLIKNIGGFL